jgi:hypothetical protein
MMLCSNEYTPLEFNFFAQMHAFVQKNPALKQFPKRLPLSQAIFSTKVKTTHYYASEFILNSSHPICFFLNKRKSAFQ